VAPHDELAPVSYDDGSLPLWAARTESRETEPPGARGLGGGVRLCLTVALGLKLGLQVVSGNKMGKICSQPSRS
jgi:hypothetical protein